MNRIRYISSIVSKDFIDSLKNRTILIVILLPVAASLLFAIIDNSPLEKTFQIGLNGEQSQDLNNFISDNVANFKPVIIQQIDKGIDQVESGIIDGLIVLEGKLSSEGQEFKVYLNSQQAANYFFIKDSIREILQGYLNRVPTVKMEIVTLSAASARVSFLPVWITITITMIGVLIVSGNIAEEKENKTLQAILVSPVSELDVLLGKGLYGIIFAFLTVFLMCLFNGVLFLNSLKLLSLSLIVLIAAASFTAIGLLIGIISSSQAAARSIGTVIYFPLLFPALIYNLSEFTRKLASFFPSYYLLKALERILLYSGDKQNSWGNILVLLGFSLPLIVISYLLFKYKKG